MVELSDDLKKDLKKVAEANQRKHATSEDLATIIHAYLPAEVQIQEDSYFMRKARLVLKPPKPEPEPIEEPQPTPIVEKKPQLSALEKVIVWFTTKLEALSQRLEQGHGSGVDADKLDGLHGEELMVRAANMAQRGRGGGTLTTDHGNLTGLDHDDHTQYALLAGRSGDTLKMDDIDEVTAAHGVDVDGVLLKDGEVYLQNDVRLVSAGTYLDIRNHADTGYKSLRYAGFTSFGNCNIVGNFSITGAVRNFQSVFDLVLKVKDAAGGGGSYQEIARFVAGASYNLAITRAGDITMLDQKMMQFGTYTDAQRPAAGTAGRMIFNTDDGMPNYDDGTNWRDINGNIT